jgi:hypothetical protein
VNRLIILASALTAPEKIKPYLQGGIWVYAGNNLKKFHAFKEYLGKEMIHASPEQFREFTISNRHAFIQWTERVHLEYGHDLTHWLSDTFSSNPHISNLFSNFMNLAWFRFILNEYPRKDIVFIAESHAMLLIAAAISSEDKGNEICKYGFSKAKISFICKTVRSIFVGYVSFLLLLIRYMYAYTYRIRKSNDNLRKVSVIVDTYFFENSFDQKGNFINKYFSELHGSLCKDGVAVGIFAIFYKVPLNKLGHLFNSIYHGKAKFILLEDFLKPIDYLSALVYPIKRLMRFEKVKDFLGISVQPLINEGNWVYLNTSNSILSLLANKLPRRLYEKKFKPRIYINWSENQTVHRATIAGFHKYFVKTEVLGGKPFFPALNHLNLFNTNSERVFGYAPDRIVTCGRGLKKVFSAYDKEGYYEMGASFRYSYLNKLVDKNYINSSERNRHSVVSIILPQSINISKYVLTLSKKAVQNAIAHGWNFRVKTHPSLTKSDVTTLLKEYDMKNECLKETQESMESLLPRTSVIVTSASSTAIEAICLGIPVVAVGMPIDLDFNMLDYLPSSMWKIAFTDDDVDLRLNQWAICHPLAYEKRREIGRRVLSDLFGEDTKNSIQAYTKSL